jgi:Zn-dependent protease
MDPVTTLVIVLIVLISVVIHEVAHGYVALWLGDTTAYYDGRLTLNPLKHLDPFGSVLLPLILSFSGVVFGWAKPVPYNPYNLRNRRLGEPLVALAGPVSNILLAIIFGLLIRFVPLDSAMLFIAASIVQVNIVLAVFNMIPIPPLDGSKILFALFPKQYGPLRATLEQWGMVLVILFIVFLWHLMTPVVSFVFTILTGIAG